MQLLAADIGGTNARFALFEGEAVVRETRLSTATYRDDRALIRAALTAVSGRPEAICLAVAGPVHNGRAHFTNARLTIDRATIEDETGVPCEVINDFHAQAVAVEALAPTELESLGGAEFDSSAPIAVIGPGTGLGEAYLIPDPRGGPALVRSSEGGHARFAPRDERELGLALHLRAAYGQHVSVERVLSGPGLVEIDRYLRGNPISVDAPNEDPAAVITRRALAGSCTIARAAVEIFVGVLGDEAANLALTLGAAGGVYITGGIVPRIASVLRNGGFRRAFVNKGRLGPWLEKVPAWLVMHPDPGLLGARLTAQRRLAPAASR